MNSMDNHITDQRGVILTDNVDLDWVNSLHPRYHKEYVKFVVDMKNNRVVIGMDIHADAQVLLGTEEEYLYGGNIYRDGHIVYQSTLNVEKNLKLEKATEKKGLFWLFKKKRPENENMRIITDKETIHYINTVLMAWVKL